jgi:hypothetical protein
LQYEAAIEDTDSFTGDINTIMIFSTNTSIARRQVWDLRQQLYTNGYRPVEIPSGIKFPVDDGWPDLARRDPPEPCCTRFPRSWLNTGILADGLRPIDVDIEDPAKVAEVVRYCADHFGPAPVRYRANSPRLLALYAAAEDEPPKSSCKNKLSDEGVEVLGRGNQFFAYGVHPSGCPLLWQDGPNTMPRCDLTRITDDQIAEFIAFCADLIDADRTSHRPLDMPMPVIERLGDEWLIGDIRAALAEIPNYGKDWEFWFRIACAVFDACGGSGEGCQAFLDWSCPHANPTRNTGKQLWNGLLSNPPDRITAGSLWHHVRENNRDWEKPSQSFTRLRIFNTQH